MQRQSRAPEGLLKGHTVSRCVRQNQTPEGKLCSTVRSDSTDCNVYNRCIIFSFICRRSHSLLHKAAQESANLNFTY